MNTKVSSQISYLLLCFVLAFLPTCGGGGGGSEHSGSGSVTVMLHVAKDSGTTLAQIDCGEIGVQTVEAEIFDATNTSIASGGPWVCDLHQGTIANVPAGCGNTIVVRGLNSDATVTYLGEVTDFCVIAGQKNDVFVELSFFEAPIVNSPTEGQWCCTEAPCTVTLTWYGGWIRNILQVDEDPEFFISQTSFMGSHDVTLGVGPHTWRVRASDSVGSTQSDWSEAAFSVAICL